MSSAGWFTMLVWDSVVFTFNKHNKSTYEGHNNSFLCGVRSISLLLDSILPVMVFLFHSSETPQCITVVYVHLLF